MKQRFFADNEKGNGVAVAVASRRVACDDVGNSTSIVHYLTLFSPPREGESAGESGRERGKDSQ